MNIIRTLSVSILLLSTLACAKKDAPVEIVKFKDLTGLLSSENEEVLVVNFWATWCAPCVKELHQFEDLLTDYQDDGMSVLLVSFDFAEQLESKVIPFIQKKGIQSKVVLLDETDYNSFIDKIDPSWSGAIPATLMVNNRNGKREFFEKEFKEGELESTYIQFTNNSTL